MKKIGKGSWEQFWLTYKNKPGSLAVLICVILAAAITVGVLFSLIIYILVNGVVHLKPELFAWEYNTSNMSMMPAIISTVYITALSLLMAVPVGIFSAIYLVEYAKRGSKLVKVIRTTTETLQGIMILPLIIRTTEEALISVPDSYREGSFGLGAGKLRTVFKIILPCAVPGILAGVILAIGRIVGESAALIFTSGTVAQVPGSLFDSARTLSVHMYALLSEGLYTNEAYATAVVLLVLVILINAFSGFIAKKLATR